MFAKKKNFVALASPEKCEHNHPKGIFDEDIIYCNRVAITAVVDKQRNGLRQQQQHSMVRAERNRDRYFMAINKLTRSTALVSRVGKEFVENSLRRLDNLIILAASCH